MDLFQPKEKFLVLEIGPDGTDGLFLGVDDDRKILLEKLEEGAPLQKFLTSPARRLSEKSWEGKHLFNGRRRVIAAADSALATTIPVPLTLPRDRVNMKTRITIAELENLIAQAMARVFNGCRNEAAKRLAVNELDAVLVAAIAKNFKVDGRGLRNPVGSAGKSITLLLEFTFATRPIFEILKPFFNSSEGLFFAEAPQVHLRALSRARKLPLNLVTAHGKTGDGTSLYLLMRPTNEYDVLYREKLNWAFPGIVRAIAEAFAVEGEAAERMYCLYHRGDVSPAAARVFQRTVEPAVEAFFGEVGRRKVKGPVYLDLPHPLPFALPHKRPGAGGTAFEKHPTEEILEELGFTVSHGGAYGRIMKNERRREVLRPLLYFIEAYFDRSDSPINQKLRRRLHWLVG